MLIFTRIKEHLIKNPHFEDSIIDIWSAK